MGPSSHTGKGNRKLISEINMVPFIDVVLVLLIIFMVMSPFLAQTELPINLPKTITNQPIDKENPISIQITKNGDFYLNKSRILRKDLKKSLKDALLKQAQHAVLIEADRDVSFKNVILALDTAEQLDAEKVGVAVLSEEEDPSK